LNDEDLIIPEDAGLQQHQLLLRKVENRIKEVGPTLTQYRVDRANARSVYDDLLSSARITAIVKHNLKANNQTIINAYASTDNDVKIAKQDWLLKRALEIKAKDRLDQLQGQRDTLKALVKSEHNSYY
jgi:hypothetical protein